MSKLSDVLGMDAGSEELADMPVIDEEPAAPKGGGSAELLAMKQFERASTTEAKVQAMKDFLEACGATGAY